MEQKPLDRLRCVVERITYQSDGYSVLKCAAKGHTDLVAVVGMMPDTHVGSVLTLGGHWKIDSKYGRQFEVVTFEETLPATVYGIEKYLGSGLMALSGSFRSRRPPLPTATFRTRPSAQRISRMRLLNSLISQLRPSTN